MYPFLDVVCDHHPDDSTTSAQHVSTVDDPPPLLHPHKFLPLLSKAVPDQSTTGDISDDSFNSLKCGGVSYFKVN